jgi:hypothetical protein
MYYIYHIEGVKIGCTTNPKGRTKKQGFTEYEILETHTDIKIASERERELQKQYGYRVDECPYYKSIIGNKEAAKKAGKIAVETGQIYKMAGLGGKALRDKVIKDDPNYFKNMGKIGSIKADGRGAIATKYKKEYAILVYKYNTNECIGEYPNQLEAAKMLGIHPQNIGRQLLGKAKQTGGYRFEYVLKRF